VVAFLHAAVESEETTASWRGNAGNVIFVCVFIVALIGVLVWWLRR
jgi:hypothetical protein